MFEKSLVDIEGMIKRALEIDVCLGRATRSSV